MWFDPRSAGKGRAAGLDALGEATRRAEEVADAAATASAHAKADADAERERHRKYATIHTHGSDPECPVCEQNIAPEKHARHLEDLRAAAGIADAHAGALRVH